MQSDSQNKSNKPATKTGKYEHTCLNSKRIHGLFKKWNEIETHENECECNKRVWRLTVLSISVVIWLVRMACNPGVWGLKLTWVFCTFTHMKSEKVDFNEKRKQERIKIIKIISIKNQKDMLGLKNINIFWNLAVIRKAVPEVCTTILKWYLTVGFCPSSMNI